MIDSDYSGHMKLFSSLVGFEYDFYGVDNTAFCIGIDGKRMAFEAIEDPSDGYRSYFDSFRIALEGNIFFGSPIARVRLIRADEDTAHPIDPYLIGWLLVDVSDDHIWLIVGTDYSDGYYPYFTFSYRPKEIESEHKL